MVRTLPAGCLWIVPPSSPVAVTTGLAAATTVPAPEGGGDGCGRSGRRGGATRLAGPHGGAAPGLQ